MDLEAVQDKVGRKLLGAIRTVAGEAVCGNALKMKMYRQSQYDYVFTQY